MGSAGVAYEIELGLPSTRRALEQTKAPIWGWKSRTVAQEQLGHDRAVDMSSDSALASSPGSISPLAVESDLCARASPISEYKP